MENGNSAYPRPLSMRERNWIEWILPTDRSGYKQYRDLIGSMIVLGKGRRGEGEIILGHRAAQPDFNQPLGPVFAYGAIESESDMVSITVREMLDDQISVEIVSHRSERIPPDFQELRRWTYSTWSPGSPCPQCRLHPREVSMHAVATAREHVVLALCPTDQRLWVFDSPSGVNRLIPVTNFYNELMLHKNIRDPKLALDSRRLFIDLSNYSDAELTHAFLTYNKIRTKVHIDGLVEADKHEPQHLARKLLNMFSRK